MVLTNVLDSGLQPKVGSGRPNGIVVEEIGVGSGKETQLRLSLNGALDISTLADAWDAMLVPIRKAKPRTVIVDAGQLEYCDGSGLGLFIEVRRTAATWGGELRLENLRPEMQRLIDMAILADPTAPQLRPPPRTGLVVHVGRATASVFNESYALVEFLGQLSAALVWTLTHPRRLRWKDLLATADKVGTDGVPVVCLLGFIIGAILAFQSAPPMGKFGGRDLIPTLVSIAVVRELGPLIASILMAGRTSSAFAAELGTMKVTEETSALTAMGLDPVAFLAVPRVIAAIVVSPVLGVISSLMGVLGGYVVMINYGFTFQRYVVQVHSAITCSDLIGGEIKTLVFGLIVGGVGCLRGIRTASGPGAVGESTTRAVVTSIVLIIAADGIFGVIYFYLGF